MIKILNFVLSTFILATASAASAAGMGDVKLNVTLRPAGSFVAESRQVTVKGSAVRNGSQVTASNIVVPVCTLKTGISLRDEHMTRKYMECGKYPNAVLTHATGRNGKFTGELMVRNIKRPISGTYQINGGTFTGHFTVKSSDFGIAKVRYMGVGVADEVNVDITLPSSLAKM